MNMDLSLILLISGIAAILIGLAFCIFGYKLARILLPLCGVLIVEGALYFFVYDLLNLSVLNTWLFFGASSIAIYLALFFAKRIAGFFMGLLAGALVSLYAVYAFGLHDFAYLYPACFTVCVMAGLLALAYQKAGVIVFSSLFGACLVSFAGLYLLIVGSDPTEFLVYGNILVPLEQFLSGNTLLVGGAALGAAVIGALLQFYVTSYKQVLSYGTPGDGSFRLKRKSARSDGWIDNESQPANHSEDFDI